MLAYATAFEMVHGRNRTRSGKYYKIKIAHNTYLERALGDPNVTVRLHDTAVVTIYPNGTYRLNSGGYRSATTKDRINKYAPVQVFQHLGTWFTTDNSGPEPRRAYFFDGMLVDSGGKVLNHYAALVAGLDPDTPREMVLDWFAERGLSVPLPLPQPQ